MSAKRAFAVCSFVALLGAAGRAGRGRPGGSADASCRRSAPCRPRPPHRGSPAAGLRDPFRPFNLALRPKPVETPRTPLEQYDVGALKLVAVIYDTQNPKAMVEDDTGLGFTIGVGTRIGNQGGVVKIIDPERVIVEEEFVDFYGEKKKSEIVLRLKPEGEKRP